MEKRYHGGTSGSTTGTEAQPGSKSQSPRHPNEVAIVLPIKDIIHYKFIATCSLVSTKTPVYYNWIQERDTNYMQQF